MDDGGFNVLLGNGNGTFSRMAAFGSTATVLVIADINRDSFADLISGYQAVLGHGDGTFGASLPIPAFGFGGVGDYNSDGIPDLASADGIALGNGDGSFQNPVTFTAGNTPLFAAADDFNRDGKADIAVSNFKSSNVSVLLSCP